MTCHSRAAAHRHLEAGIRPPSRLAIEDQVEQLPRHHPPGLTLGAWLPDIPVDAVGHAELARAIDQAELNPVAGDAGAQASRVRRRRLTDCD